MAAISALMIDVESPSDSPHQLHDRNNARPDERARTPRPADIASITNAREDSHETPPKESIGSPMAITNDPDPADLQSHMQPESESGTTEALVDGENNDGVEQEDGSEEDGEQDGEDDGSSRKKRGQRFFCTGYPPCNLSFTRSEHLARHIRKHTGERPFQCHCNRRFSRLDNLRQHAQTVHVNEEIPGDSLAATGTRYQRQIRTDRVRTVPRPRTNAASSTSTATHPNAHARGHSRNLSTSSVGSTSSMYSNAAADARRRPPPLLMSSDNRPTTPPTYSQFSTHSPGTADLTTPTSSTFPGTPGSPSFSTIGSPPYTSARPNVDNRTPSRRLSVPAGYNPYYPYANPNGPAYGPGPAVPNTPSTSSITSPLSTSFPHSQSSPYSATEDWRRRTWHSSTLNATGMSYNRPATSGLFYSQTPDTPQPAYDQSSASAASQAPRLPGIESFDHVQHRPTTPPRSKVSPPLSSRQGPPPLLAAPDLDRDKRMAGYGHAHHASWDGTRRSLYPDIDEHGRPATHWGRQTLEQLDQHRDGRSHAVMGPPSQTTHLAQTQQMAQEALRSESASKRVKRSGQYPGFISAYRTSPDSSSSEGIATPGTSAVEVNPAIIGSNGYIEPQLLGGDAQNTRCLVHPSNSPGPPPFRPARRPSELDRLEALVAVATSEPSR